MYAELNNLGFEEINTMGLTKGQLRSNHIRALNSSEIQQVTFREEHK